MTTSKKICLFLFIMSLLLSLTACGSSKVNTAKEGKTAEKVKGQSVAQSQSVKEEYEYPALVLSEQEAKVIAKTSGTVKMMNYKLGNVVAAGNLLARIDDISQSGAYNSGLNANQVRQAQLAVEQAESNKRNLALTSAETIKNLQIAYESAKIATIQAKLSLENRQAGIKQSYSDVDTNAATIADSVANTCSTIITGVNSIAHFDPTAIGDSIYKDNLGVIDNQLSINAKNVFLATQSFYNEYRANNLADVKTKIDETIKLAEQTNILADTTKNYIDASLVGGQLTQTVFSGWQTAAASYQTQVSAALTQIKGAKQASENNTISNNTNSDALTKTYELAQQQEKTAGQALNIQRANVKANQDAADLAYRNALIGLQSIIDSHQVIAPISGRVTQSFISVGGTVSFGQELATISSGQSIKFPIYVDEAVLKQLSQDQPVIIKTNDQKQISGKITGLASQADSLTKRFLVEIAPVDFTAADFTLGTVVNIIITIEKRSAGGQVILPLSALEVGQNGNFVLTIENGRAKKIPVEIIKISGETAEIKTDLLDSAVIITDGNKLVEDGDAIELSE